MVASFSDAQRAALLAAATAVVYTPSEEHFGIVTLEAMAASRPVIACNSGGPIESVVHGRTGFLCHATPPAFAEAMGRLLVRPFTGGQGALGCLLHSTKRYEACIDLKLACGRGRLSMCQGSPCCCTMLHAAGCVTTMYA